MKICIAPIVFSAWLTLLAYRLLSSSRRRRKHGQIRHHHNQDDAIGELPDCVLISILTLLPVKDAIRTSVLSKRWTTLYKFVVHLNLHCHHLDNDRYRFDMVKRYVYRHCNIDISFITRRLYKSIDIRHISSKYFDSRRGSKIHSLVFCCCLIKSYPYHFSYMGGFRAFLKYLDSTADVKKLVVQCCCLAMQPQPCCPYSYSCVHLLYCMPRLRYLEFKSIYTWQCLPKLHTNMSLRNMRLSKVTVLDGALDLILSGCLGLCSLRMDYCEFRSSKLHICGPNLRLEHLDIEECRGVEEIELCANNLVTFEFQSRSKVVELIFDHVPRLQSMYYVFEQDIMLHVFVRRPSELPTNQLKSLAFVNKYDISKAVIYWVRKVGQTNTYSNLRQLRLRFSHTTYTTMLLGIIRLLRSCPLLLEFHLDTETVESDGRKAMRPPTAETHSHLKKVEITGFCGSINEIEFALYILENATCLEQMQISRCPNKWHTGFGRWMEHEDKPRWSRQTRKNIRQQLQGRALSETARIFIFFTASGVLTSHSFFVFFFFTFSAANFRIASSFPAVVSIFFGRIEVLAEVGIVYELLTLTIFFDLTSLFN
ncbi:F-box/FBD/LRR-repeat protein [Striga hermonthica]|uniref:F-box/FBD/LRR-repeat protein n=1 Tax=Striga hermonthica TaxID=68872 RepID=A0A9N7NCE4_STRHE|nr:F-box/FBD/LRR-repeat protein [Striga hermonthica]